MVSRTRLREAYMYGCKLAILNSTELRDRMLEVAPVENEEGDMVGSEGSDVMRNENERVKSEASAPYGEKHQLATTPDWVNSND